MRARTGTAAGLLLLLGACAGPDAAGKGAGTGAATAAGSALVVECLDEARDTVSRVPAGACGGTVLSAQQAADHARERARKTRALVRTPRDAPEGRIAGTGTGFFVGPEGEVLTNRHVVDGCASLSVLLPGEGRRPATARALHDSADLALLDTGAASPAVARFSAAPERTEALNASVVGFPALGAPTVLATMTAVRPSNPSRGESFSVIGPIRFGHSGSAVLDQSALVIGVVRGRIEADAILAATGQRIDDVGVAVTPGVALAFLEAQRVALERVAPGPAMGDSQVLEEARRWTVRVECRR